MESAEGHSEGGSRGSAVEWTSEHFETHQAKAQRPALQLISLLTSDKKQIFELQFYHLKYRDNSTYFIRKYL